MSHTFKIEQLLSTAAELGFTKHDFADLALVAARRSGATAAAHTLVTTALGIEVEESDRGTKRDHVSALAQICRQLGGRLAIVSQRTLNDLFNRDWPDEGDEDSDELDLEHHEGFSPSAEDDMNHGLNWREKIVYAVRGHERVASIIHEMGHVFADRLWCSTWTPRCIRTRSPSGSTRPTCADLLCLRIETVTPPTACLAASRTLPWNCRIYPRIKPSREILGHGRGSPTDVRDPARTGQCISDLA